MELLNTMKIKRKPIFIIKRKISTTEIIQFTSHLATMISAGIPLVKAIESIARIQPNKHMETILISIKNAISQGASLSNTLKEYPTAFDSLYCNLIRCAEESSTLDTMLYQMVKYLEKSQLLKKKVKQACTYPVVIMVTSLFVCSILLFFVVPQFINIFNAFNAPLPFFTRIIIDSSQSFRRYSHLLPIAIGMVFYCIKILNRYSTWLESYLDSAKLKLIVFGPLITKSIIARITRTLSVTLGAGMPLVDALASVSNNANNSVYKDALLAIREAVMTGQCLNTAFTSTNLFPVLVTQMLAVGEESSAVEDMLDKIATHYEDEVDDIVSHLGQLIEPIIMLAVGCIVGCFVIGMYMPLFKLGSLLN